MPANNPRLQRRAPNLYFDPLLKRWHVRKTFDGRTHQKGGFISKSSAQQYLDWLILQHATGVDLAPAPTIEAATADYLGYLDLMRRSPRTVAYYSGKFAVLHDGLDNRRLDQLTQRHIDDYIVARQQAGIGNGSIIKEQKALLTLYRHTKTEPRWDYRPLSHSSARRRTFPADRVRTMWDHLTAAARLAVGLCLFTGMRAETAYAATADWVDGDELIIPEWAVKTGEGARTYLVPTLRALLPDIAPAGAKLVTLNRDQLRREINAACAVAGIRPAINGIGHFRHHCATYAAEAGYSTGDIKQVTSHKTGSVTDRYVHSQSIMLKTRILTAVEHTIFPELADQEATNENHS